MPAPALCRIGGTLPPGRRWLLKPLRGAGGTGIRFASEGAPLPGTSPTYRQEFIEGQPVALLFVASGGEARFLGMTQQLVGERWLHAAPFHYCGSIGPLDPDIVRRPTLETLGDVLARGCKLSGLFGVDGIMREGEFYPVEINPRYTASVEVLEYSTGAPLLGWRSDVVLGGRLPPPSSLPSCANRYVGKAILFARDDLNFPVDGPWMAELRSPTTVQEMPTFADIPAAGDRIEAGRPVLTFFVTANLPSACEDALRETAADLDLLLFGR